MIIDVTRLIGRTLKGYHPTGIDRVCIEYLKHFLGQAKVSVYLKIGNFPEKFLLLNRKFSERLSVTLIKRDSRKLKKLLPLIPLNTEKPKQKEVYFNLSHSGGLDSVNFVKVMFPKQFKHVFMLHDIIPIKYPEFGNNNQKQKHYIRISNMFSLDSIVLTNSEYTRQNLLTYLTNRQEFQFSPERVITNHLGFCSFLNQTAPLGLIEIKERYGIKREYFLVVSTLEPRKNHLTLFYAWYKILNKLHDKAPQLVVVGRNGWKDKYIIDFINHSSIAAYVKHISNCPDDLLKGLLLGCKALLMPSIEEGFGLPVLEALSLGVPVICSDIEVFRELFKDIPLYCNWADASAWAEKLIKILTQQDFLSNLKESQQQKFKEVAYYYSWESHFTRLHSILQEHIIDN